MQNVRLGVRRGGGVFDTRAVTQLVTVWRLALLAASDHAQRSNGSLRVEMDHRGSAVAAGDDDQATAVGQAVR